MNVLVVQYLVTLSEATKIVRFFKKKKHNKMGYFFELEELGMPISLAVERFDTIEAYASQYSTDAPSSPAKWLKPAYLLKVYRDVPVTNK